MIEARGLCARVGSFTLTDVTFEVPRGAYGVVIGPAGSGKTTLLETVAGIIRPFAGELRLAGQNVAGVPPERRDLALVYQHGYLFPHLSVAENVAYGARDDAVAGEIIQRLDVGTFRDRDVASLSGGERQLISLARALARRPSATC